MLRRFMDTIRGMSHASEFETYYSRIQHHSYPGTPTIDEAKQDYQANAGYINLVETFDPF